MKKNTVFILGTSLGSLFAFLPICHAGQLIDTTAMTADANGNWPGRDAGRTLNGLTANADFAVDGTVFLASGGDANTPGDYRVDATAANNNQVGQPTNWSYQGISQGSLWVRVDLAQDYRLESMNIFNLAVNMSANGTDWTRRSSQEVDIYYRNALSGPGDNVGRNGPGGEQVAETFDPNGWTLLNTTTLSRTVEASTEISPETIAMGGITARYIAVVVRSNYSEGIDNSAGIAEFQFFEDTSTPADDPILKIDDTGTTEEDFRFGSLLQPTTRTLTFVNDSASGNGTINIESISITDDANGAFAIVGSPSYSNAANSPLLSNGDSVSITVQATNNATGELAGTLVIDSTSSGGNIGADFNDLEIPIVAESFLPNAILNTNPFFDEGLSDWQGNSNLITPGFAPGSSSAVVLPGEGGPFAEVEAVLYNNSITNGAADWEFSTYFTPITRDNFEDYVQSVPDGELADRTFQWVLLSDDTNAPNPRYNETQADRTLINLAYFPVSPGVESAGDFFVYDNMSLEWVSLGIGEIAGSVDADTSDQGVGNGDGILDPSPGSQDEVNVYRLVVRGTGFGTPNASYDVTVTKVSGPDTFTSGSSTGREEFFRVNGANATPAAFAFITSDLVFDTNENQAFTPPFWVDDVAFFNSSAPNPSLSLLSTPSFIEVDAPATPTGTSSFSLRNDGTSENLDISSINFNRNGFSVISPSVPFSIAPGSLQEITIGWDSTAADNSTYERATMTVLTNDPSNSTINLDIDAGIPGVSQTKLLANSDFETPGTDPAGDTDTFAVWEEANINDDEATANNAINVPSLVGTGESAYLRGASDGGVYLSQTVTAPLSSFELLCDFAFLEGGALQWGVVLNGLGTEVNIRLNGNNLQIFNGLSIPTGYETVMNLGATSPLLPSEDADNNGSLNDAGDTKNVYRARVICNGWGTLDPTTSIEFLDLSGTVLASGGPFRVFRDGVPNTPTSRLNRVRFQTQFSGAPGFWIDNVCLDGNELITDENIVITPPIGGLTVTDSTFNTTTGNVTLTVSGTEDGTSYDVQAADDLRFTDTAVETVVGEDATTTINFVDTDLVGKATRFYRIVEQ